ncbi:hypothetical protein HJC23_009326 [Cyclotella cryptica]|uniref:SET domain-containing protein n=1 Tax=Cyclotella cryptica TaxID=29204 RepID=A0ABD3QT88_9STRA|eukprot:CCRYP_002303-RA/>CCRYP_002303-RA protein AED:0.00 eAED:0.00 QI:224/-1/1/1/-1/1/1/29/555
MNISRLNRIAVPTLLFLLVANFTVFLIHVWYLLPHPSDNAGLGFIQPYDYADSATGQLKKRVRKSFHGDSSLVTTALTQAFSEAGTIPYDVVPKILEKSQKFYGVVHQLPSIPARRGMIPGTYGNFTVPSNAVHNLTYFLEARERFDEEDRPLYIYNPNLLPLDYGRIETEIIDDLTYGITNAKVAYVAVYRVSNFGNCHGPGRGVPQTYRNYLGLALLDRDLNIVRDVTNGYYFDVVIDLNQQLFDSGFSPGGKKRAKPTQSMQDCQLYATVTKGSTKSNRLILQCNEYVMPVMLKVAGAPERSPHLGVKMIQFRNSYGAGLQLTALQHPISIVYGGKNMHHFGPGYIETWPSGPHEYVKVDFAADPFVNARQSDAVLKSPGVEPAASFLTPDQFSSTLIDRDSGSACCVTIRWRDDDEQERNLLLGFSHRKTRKAPKKNAYNYVSRLYAFETTPPFNIVARSGFFCLGFAAHGDADDEARQSDNEQVRGSANDYRLTIMNEVYDCPRIHFVTGITEKIDDDEMVIISYGVNDCYPRMIEVPKEFLVSLLQGRR